MIHIKPSSRRLVYIALSFFLVAGALRRETGKEWTVKVRYDEGVSTRIGPGPCVTTCEGGGEASAGEHMASH